VSRAEDKGSDRRAALNRGRNSNQEREQNIDRYAVIGHPVAHSLSPRIHELFAQQTGQSLSYERLEAPLHDFRGTIERFVAGGGQGCNVTVPFKAEAAAWVDRLDNGAALAGAVNTVVVDSAGTCGYNTDGPGLVKDLERLLTETAGTAQGVAGQEKSMKVLLLGAGGAAMGVAGPLLDSLAGELIIANRTVARAEQLARRLCADRDRPVRVRPLNEAGGGFDLVINATSAGLDGRFPELAAAVVQGAFCYDLVYGGQTAFCRWALACGARQAWDGLGMLVEQAALAFELWRGVLPDTAVVLRELRGELDASRSAGVDR
jgi:shikimate dehydrogenase